MKEMPVTEMVATLELFAHYGVTREDLAMLRGSPVYAKHITTELKGVRKLQVQHGWSHYEGEGAFVAFTEWMNTYNAVLMYYGSKKNFFVAFRGLITSHGEVQDPTSYEQELPFMIIKEAVRQMDLWPDAVKKSGYALPIRKIAALMTETSAAIILAKKFQLNPAEFAISLGGSDPRNTWSPEDRRRFTIATHFAILRPKI